VARISPARQAAFDILLEWKRKPELHSDVLLHSRVMRGLSTLDTHLATTLVMGVLRWKLALDERITAKLTRAKSQLADPVWAALQLGALQLLLLERIPAHAAIFESVELVRQSGNAYAVGLVNAVLRKLAQDPRLAERDALAAHPGWLRDRWAAAYGTQIMEAICRYDQLPPPATVRLAKDAADAGLEPAVYVSRAARVTGGEIPSHLRLQDEGSQLIAEVAGHGEEILDCCAAPGGKTAILRERNPQASLTACDVSPRRLKAMETMLGPQSGIHFRLADATELPLPAEFDLVLCDAPCSGTGTLARNPEIRHRLTLEDLRRHQTRQEALLGSAMGALRPGGRVVYSTCSLEPEENEAVVTKLLRQHKGFRLLPWRDQACTLEQEGTLRPGATERLFPPGTSDDFLRIFPGQYPGDGFFAACIVKEDKPSS
jgi:16S rRNA (cytosine967-C5)-methyltransferase